MPLKKFRPNTPGTRGLTLISKKGLWRGKPLKSLTAGLSKKGGRNNTGRIMVRRRGGGHKRRYRIIDYKRTKFGVEGKVATIEYDPNRSAYISLIHYLDGDKRYILSPLNIKVGDKVISDEKVPLKTGNALKLINIPTE